MPDSVNQSLPGNASHYDPWIDSSFHGCHTSGVLVLFSFFIIRAGEDTERKLINFLIIVGSAALGFSATIATVVFGNRIGFDRGAVIGYTSIVLSFLLVFFGIRSYRDNIGNGQITFWKAFVVGMSITLISCICYVVTWEVIYYNFLPGFWDKYGAHLVEKLRASGASPAAIQAKREEVAKYKEMYKNPLLNAALTFIEPFPIGLVITLISAAVLRRNLQLQPDQSPLPAS